MDALKELAAALAITIAEWRGLNFADLRYGHSRAAVLTVIALVALVLLLLLVRSLHSRTSIRGQLVLPALPPVLRSSPLAATRHTPLLMFLAGLPFFAMALADPYTAFTHEQASYPGRRIAVMIDASSSMNQPFVSAKLNRDRGPTYFATVAAAEYFMRLRMQGPHRDLISLIEFGNEAYVVTPFTTDYDNVLLSLRLIAAPNEWERFPDQGTTIIQAIRQATQLFLAFDFLNASGNLMVIFSDGQDTQTLLNGRSLDDIVADARRHKIPVYFIRMAYNQALGGVVADEMWRKAVAATGGRFYAGSDERTILRAVHEIDQLAPGRVDVREYVVQQPRFAGYVLIAVTLWITASLSTLCLRHFRSFT